jgi:hypothetical protein
MTAEKYIARHITLRNAYAAARRVFFLEQRRWLFLTAMPGTVSGSALANCRHTCNGGEMDAYCVLSAIR